MKFVLFTAVCFMAYISCATALDCYLCMGSTESDCMRNNNASMMIQYCPVYPQSRNYCVSYVSTDSVQMSGGYVRGCGFMRKEDNRDICDYLIELKMAVSCDDCESDLCNINTV